MRARLREAGLSAFLDRYSLPAGQPWQPWLERELGTCGALLALLGPRGIGEWQHREIQLGLDRQASTTRAERAFPVIPVLLPGLAADAIPVGQFLNLNTWVDLRNGFDDPQAIQRLVAGAQGRRLTVPRRRSFSRPSRPIAAFCRSASRTRASSSVASASSTSSSRRSAPAQAQMSSRSLAAREAGSRRSSTRASSRRSAASGASARSLSGGSSTCVLMTSR
jgi:hypothetical protein